MKRIVGILLVAAIALGGCATATPVSRAAQADMVLTQLEATLLSAEAVAAQLDDEGTPPEELVVARIVLAALKPQIAAWIGIYESIRGTPQDQDTDVALLVARANALP